MKQRNKVLGSSIALAAALGIMVMPAAAYERYESVIVNGGTRITVYKGTVDENNETYLEDTAKDYVAYNVFCTSGSIVSTSNITPATVFEEMSSGSSEGNRYTCNGGVEGVSWDNDSSTLLLNNAKGTVIKIAGPELDVANLNTPNRMMETNIDIHMPNLTYYNQSDFFLVNGDGNPHFKENIAGQDTVTILLEGENEFHNILLSGNIKVVFAGTGSLILDAAGDLGGFYTDQEASGYAISSYVTIGSEGVLSNKEDEEGLKTESSSKNPEGMEIARTIEEWFAYDLPEIELDENLLIQEGGEIVDTAQIAADYFIFKGETSVLDESRIATDVQELSNHSVLHVNGDRYDLVFDDAKTVFYVTVEEGMGPGRTVIYYDVTDGIENYEPWVTYVGTENVPAVNVVISAEQ